MIGGRRRAGAVVMQSNRIVDCEVVSIDICNIAVAGGMKHSVIAGHVEGVM